MAAKKEDTTLYVRNRRPNRVVLKYADTRITLEHRGSRDDSTALPGEAVNDAVINRWIKNGVLEKISKEAFMKLGARTVDVQPNQFLKRPVRNAKSADLILGVADGNTTGEKLHINETAARKSSTPELEWAGELMTTDEELEESRYEQGNANYPSHHRE